MCKIVKFVNGCNCYAKDHNAHSAKTLKNRLMVLAAILLFLAGCTKNPSPYDTEDWKKAKMVSIGTEIVQAMEIGDPIILMIANSEEPNAWVDGDQVFFTDGMFNHFDDDGLRFIMAHELAHVKLGHIRKRMVLDYTTTGIMMIVGAFIPGAGLLNYAVNPAIINTYSKSQEIEADIMASETCSNIGVSIEKQVKTFMIMKSIYDSGGGFFDQHPSWDDRINNLKESHDDQS